MSETARVRLAGVAAALLAALALLLGGGDRVDRPSFDAWQRLLPRDLADMRVVVVAIDPESLRAVGPWPWSRYDMARLTERIGQMHPAAIGFDAFFPEPDRQTPALFAARYPELDPAARAAVLRLPSLDDAFAQVLGRLPTVLARAGVAKDSVDYRERSYDDAAHLPVEAMFAAPLPRGVAAWPQAIASIPAIEETAAGHGLVNGDPDDDGVVRRVPAVGLLHGAANPGFALELARVALRAETIVPVVAHGRLTALRLGMRTIPVAADGRLRPRFGTVPGRAIVSAADVLRRGFDPARLAGRVAIVSVTGSGGSDIAATPLDAQIDGVLVQAQAADAILRGGLLVRPRWAIAAETALGLLLGGAAIWLLPRRRARAAVGVVAGASVFVPAASLAAYAGAGLLLGPVRPLLIGGAGTLAVLVALFAQGRALQRALRAALDVERLAAARTAGELAAARDIQQGMLPPRETLATLDPAFDIDAVLEPARSVGGDFFDAFALPDGRLAFLVGDVTGKGVPAALFMALAKALARTMLLRHGGALGEAVAALAAELSRDNAQAMFVTMLVGVADGRTGLVELVNAGHEDPLLVRADGGVEPLAMDGGPPLCVADDFPYPVEHATLAPGEGLVIVTDGITEAQDADGTLIARDAVTAALGGLGAGWSATGAATALVRAVRGFEAGAEPSDDLTVLVVRRS